MKQPFDPSIIHQPEVQHLIAMLQQQNGQLLGKAAAAIEAGDYGAATALLRPIAGDPAYHAILEKLRGRNG